MTTPATHDSGADAPAFNPVSIKNDGDRIVESSYFTGPLEKAGHFFVSVNAGCVRILWPRGRRRDIDEMRGASHVILTRGILQGEEGLEILFEDSTPSPFTLHLTKSMSDTLPEDPGGGSAWSVAVWMWRENKPRRLLSRPARWRRVPSLPCLEPWMDAPEGGRSQN